MALHVAAGGIVAYGRSTPLDWWFLNGVDAAVRWSVPVFIMLSGALLLGRDADQPPGEFYRKRCARIGLPLLFWAAFYMALMSRFSSHPASAGRVLQDLLEGVPFPTLHFLFALAGLYLFTPVLRPFVQRASAASVLWIAGVMLALTAADRCVRGLYPELDVSPTMFSRFVPYVGYYLAGHALREVRLTARAALAVALGLVASIALTAVGTQYLSARAEPPLCFFWYNFLSPSVIVMSLCAFLLLGQYGRGSGAAGRFAGLLRALSPLTFGVYLVHPLFVSLLLRLGMGWGEPNVWIGVPLTVVVVTLCSLAATWLLRRLPWGRMVVG